MFKRLPKSVVYGVPAALGIASLAVFMTDRADVRSHGTTMVGLGDAATVERAYASWTALVEDDERLIVGLQYYKGLSEDMTKARGRYELDMLSGEIVAEVCDLPAGDSYDLWLMDNRQFAGHSVRPQAEDAFVRVGTFAYEDGIAYLQERLDPRDFEGFDIDLAAVTRSDEHPTEAGILFGAPSLFQRVFFGRPDRPFTMRADGEEPQASQASPQLALASLFPSMAPAAAAPSLSASDLVALGEELFFEEEFRGNGRTCGSCHPAENNFTIDPRFISTRSDDDRLFVAEIVPHLAELENPELMRSLGLILENVDGFDRPGVMRAVNHTLALSTTIAPPPNAIDGLGTPPLERTGWGGDGAPNNGSLRDFATGAVTQHLTMDLQRIAGLHFLLPTELQLDALEAFQLSLGRSEDPDLASMTFTLDLIERGKELFMAETTEDGDLAAGRCMTCHHNAGATGSPTLKDSLGVVDVGNFNFSFDVGTLELEETLADMVDAAGNPPDAGFGQDPNPNVELGGFGTGIFNIPPLVEAADTGGYFHNHQALTLEAATIFYLGGEFNGSAGADVLEVIDDPPGFGVMNLNDSQASAIAAFLRVLNVLENVRSALAYMEALSPSGMGFNSDDARRRVRSAAVNDLQDGIEVLTAINLHTDVVEHLKAAKRSLVLSFAFPWFLNSAMYHAEQCPPLMVSQP